MIRTVFFLTVLVEALINITAFGQDLQGCFLYNFEPKNAEIPLSIDTSLTSSGITSAVIKIDFSDTIGKVSKYIYGTNTNQYCGNLNLETKLVYNIKLLNPHIIRYPGGLHSNEYYWSTGVTKSGLPKDIPAKLLDGTGKAYSPYYVPGNGGFPLNNFYDLLKKTGCEALITVNYSYARYGTGPTPVQTAAKLAADWVRYDYQKTQSLGLPYTKFWEVGNENCASWASGYFIDTALNQDGQPQVITPKLYGEQFKVFADSMKKAANELGITIYIGSQNDVGVYEGAGNSPDWVVDHTYFTAYNESTSTPDAILNSVIPEADNYLRKTAAEAKKYGTDVKPCTLTEWNIFSINHKQTISYINGIHGVMVFGELIKRKYGMANRWNICNGSGSNGDDFGTFSRGDDLDGSAYKWNPRPAFFYMYYFQKFFGDHIVKDSVIGSKDILVYSSIFASGEAGIVLVNRSNLDQKVNILPGNYGIGNKFYMYTLTGGTDNDNFSLQTFVNGTGPKTQIGGPIDELNLINAYAIQTGNQMLIPSPKYSVEFILLEKGSKPEFTIVPLTDISITSQDNITTIDSVKGTLQLSVIPVPDNATNPTVIWSVDDKTKASVSQYGLVTAKKEGQIVVTASSTEDPSIKDNITITVNSTTKVESFNISDLEMFYNAKERYLLIKNAGSINLFELFSIDGKELFSVKNYSDETILPLNNLQTGIYIIHAKSGKDIFVRKFIIY